MSTARVFGLNSQEVDSFFRRFLEYDEEYAAESLQLLNLIPTRPR
jgi:hypothetical protein